VLNETQQDPAFPASALALDTPNENTEARHVSTITSLVMTDSASGYMHVTPLRNKNQWGMVQEFLMFAGVLGYAELTFRCDSEPTLLQLQRYVINARRSMGLVTHKSSPPPYSHSIGLVEYVVGRIRPLAATLTWQNSLQFNFQATVLGLGRSDMRHGSATDLPLATECFHIKSSMRRNSLESFADLVSRRLDFQGWKAKALRNGGGCCSLERRSLHDFCTLELGVRTWIWR
jgi:hypothetical protein